MFVSKRLLLEKVVRQGNCPTTATGGSKFHFKVEESVAIICQKIAHGLGQGTESELAIAILFKFHGVLDSNYNTIIRNADH